MPDTVFESNGIFHTDKSAACALMHSVIVAHIATEETVHGFSVASTLRALIMLANPHVLMMGWGDSSS